MKRRAVAARIDPGASVAKKDWKRAARDALEALGDRVRDALDALDGLFAPPPELVPVPVPVRPGPSDDPRRR